MEVLEVQLHLEKRQVNKRRLEIKSIKPFPLLD